MYTAPGGSAPDAAAAPVERMAPSISRIMLSIWGLQAVAVG
jgi:hypothetical protein